MAEILYRHKQRLSMRRYEVDEIAFSHEIVPSIESDAVQEFAAELSGVPPVTVPLRDDDDVLYGYPADGIREKILTDGGSIQFGWRLREWPGVVLTAEFHAVWVDPEGTLVDITPAVIGDEPSAFVPDPTYPDTFDFDQHPPNRYKVLHTAPDRSEAVANRIAQMKPAQRAYEERRASKSGKTLEEWILGKFPTDPLVQPIAAFVDACQAFDARLPGLPGLIQTDPHTIANEMVEVARLAAAGSAIAADAASEATIDDAHDQEGSGEHEQEASGEHGQGVSGGPEQGVSGGPEQDVSDGHGQEVSGEHGQKVSGGPEQEVFGEREQAADAAPADAPDNAAGATAEAVGNATGDIATRDDPDAEFEDTWLPEYETEAAEDELFDWSDDRFQRRRDIMRLTRQT
jgi:hypothetical protein